VIAKRNRAKEKKNTATLTMPKKKKTGEEMVVNREGRAKKPRVLQKKKDTGRALIRVQDHPQEKGGGGLYKKRNSFRKRKKTKKWGSRHRRKKAGEPAYPKGNLDRGKRTGGSQRDAIHPKTKERGLPVTCLGRK